MAEPDGFDDNTVNSPPPSPRIEPVDDTMTHDDFQAASFEADDNVNGENFQVVPMEVDDDMDGDDLQATAAEIDDDMNGDDFQATTAEIDDDMNGEDFRAASEEVDSMNPVPEDQQEDVLPSIEDDLEPELEMPTQSEANLAMADQDEDSQEHGGNHMDYTVDGSYEAADINDHDVHGSQDGDDSITHDDDGDFPDSVEDAMHVVSAELQENLETASTGSQEDSNNQPVPMEDEGGDNNSLNYYREDSQTLFVPEHEESPPSERQSEQSANIGPISRPRAPFQSAGKLLSAAARIRNMQKRYQEKKLASNRHTMSRPPNVNPDSETYLEAIMPVQSPSAQTAPVDEYELADKQASMEFQKQKRYYEELRKKDGGTLSFRHDVEWLKIKGAEEARRKKQQRDIAKAREEENKGEPDLFPVIQSGGNGDPDEESDDPFEVDGSGSRKRRRREMPSKEHKQMSMQDAELRSMQVALEAEGDNPRKKKKGKGAEDDPPAAGSSKRGKGPKPKSTKGPKAKTAPKKPAKNGGNRRTAKNKRAVEYAVKQATSLFNSNVFQQQAGAGASEQPVFRSRVKADALKELIASVPIEDQKKAKGEMNVLLAATKDFDGRGAVKSDGAGLWLVKGMRTSLKSYQVLGTAFMRRRENATEEPRGGLMADQMGLGKTLMMLANIVNGQPPKGFKGPRTTLLVASPALLSQWKSEIEQHTDCKFKIMRYGTGTRVDSNEAISILGSHDIILTTYTEIMKSYPKNEPPIDRQTAEQKIAWWKEVYEKNRGVLHRMIFLRIVLDEAQAIKNHMGRTSIACRALMAQHKWALSGTPILNGLSELYPYFKFLGVPHTGSFKIFKHNYCDSKVSENTERLLVRLSQFMIRRTHADEMFGAPILKLPQADQITYHCEFNNVERCIYEIVRVRFAKHINMWAKNGELEKSYSNVLVMLLRLRQLTAHVLMLQFVMRDLLEREDIERIKEVVDNQAADSKSRRGQTIKAVRQQLDKYAVEQKKKSIAVAAGKKAAKLAGRQFNKEDIDFPLEEGEDENEVEDDESVPEPTEQIIGGRGASGGTFGKEYNFKPFLASLKTGESWEKAKVKAICNYCKKQPKNPCMLSCKHLVCDEPCREAAMMKAAEEGRDNAPCGICGETSTYIHLCEVEDEDFPEIVARGTRSQKAKKTEKARERREREDIREDWLSSLGDDVLPSAKTIAVKAQIINWTKENPDVKVIVYTQFLAMIRILARICQNEGWQIEQYHGKMSFPARDKAISSFANDPETRIMLASLRCGGLGLNLTMASKVIMIDPWWNSASEQQAFCRVFRIGQKEETFMSRLCVKDTVDQDLIEMQERKQGEIDAVMEDGGKTTKKLDIRDLMRLFGNLQEDSEGKPFIMVDNPDPRGGFRADRDDEGYADEV